MSLAFSPDGRTLAAGGYRLIRLWDVQSGALLHTPEGHTSFVSSLGFSPDGRMLVSGSKDGSIRLWGIP